MTPEDLTAAVATAVTPDELRAVAARLEDENEMPSYAANYAVEVALEREGRIEGAIGIE